MVRLKRKMAVWGERFSRSFIALIEKAKLSEHTFILVLAVIIGLVGGFGAVLIHYAIHGFQELFWGGTFSVEMLNNTPWYHKLAIMVLGGVVVGLVIRFVAKEAKGHGVPEVMEAITLRNGIIRLRVMFAKLFASSFYIASGGSVGQEGPVIQIGSAIGSVTGQFIKANPKRMRTFVACGAASGIAAAFNAPIAGALFALEIILGDFAVAQFSPIVISSVTATVVSRHFLGDNPAFVVTKYSLESPLELLNYVALGFLAGMVAVAFIKSLYFSEDFFDRLNIPDYIKGAIGGVFLAGIGMLFPEVLGVGYDAMDAALSSSMVWKVAFVLVAVKIISTSFSLGSGGSGGIFAPSLFLGALLGAGFGGLVNSIFPEWTADAGAYALVAMGGVVGAATHGPIAAILIIFELTNDYKIILPLMITTIIATIFAQKLHKESIYTLKLVRKGINIFGGRELNVLKSLKVSDVVKQSIEVISEQDRFSTIIERISSSQHNFIYVQNEQSALSGFISMQEIRKTLLDFEALKDILIAADIANPAVVSIRESDTLDFVMKQFGYTGMDELPVIAGEGDEMQIVGTIWQRDVIEVYNHQIFMRDMSGEVEQSIQNLKKVKTVHVVEDYHLSEVEAPAIFINKNLRSISLRNKYDLELLLIKRTTLINRKSETRYIQPGAKTEVKMNDILLVFGPQDKVDKLHKI